MLHGSGARKNRDAFDTAATRWFNVNEIVDLLTPGSTPMGISSLPPTSPPKSGALLLYDRSVTRNYKDDGYEWVKKRNSNKIREDHVKLRINGKFRVAGWYAHCSSRSTMHRRAYHLLVDSASVSGGKDGGGGGEDTSGGGGGSSSGTFMRESNWVLVHYLDSKEAAIASMRKQAQDGHQVTMIPGTTPHCEETMNGSISHVQNMLSSDTRPQHPSDMSGFTEFQSSFDAKQIQRQASAAVMEATREMDILPSQQKGGGDVNKLLQQTTRPHPESFMLSAENSFGDVHSNFGQQETSAISSSAEDLTGENDSEMMGILWDMVLSDDVAGGSGVVGSEGLPVGTADEIRCASSSTITQHLSTDLEDEIFKTMEQASLDKRILGADLSGVDLGTELMQKFEHRMNPALEGKLMKCIEEQMHFAGMASQEQMAIDGTMGPAFSKGGPISMSQQNQMWNETQLQKQLQAIPTPAVSRDGTSLSNVSDVPSLLPEVVDFTPEAGPIFVQKKIKVVLSTSAPMHELKGSWEYFAAFVDIVPIDPNQQAGVSQRQQLGLVIRNVALSRVRKLTPFSYKCDLPRSVTQPGHRAIVLVGVPNANGADPDNATLCASVVLALQAKCNIALSARASSVGCPADNARPTFFTQTVSLGTGTIQVMTQLSEDFFEFKAEPAGPKRHPEQQKQVCDQWDNDGSGLKAPTPKAGVSSLGSLSKMYSNGASSVGSRNLALPSPAIASIANALKTFKEKPPENMVRGPLTVEENSDDADENDCGDNDGGDDDCGVGRSDKRKRPEPRQKQKNRSARAVAKRPTDAEVGNIFSLSNEWCCSRSVCSASVGGDDYSIAESVNRHCKVRFVESLANAIKGAEESGVDKLSETGRGSMRQEAPRNSSGFEVGSNGDMGFLKDEQVEGMDDFQLDALLDGLLIRVVETLLETGKNDREERLDYLNSLGPSGFALMHYASIYNLQSLIPTLLSHGANPDVVTAEGKLTPLHLSCGAGHWGIVELLVRSQCSVGALDAYDRTPADHAVLNKHPDIACWLDQRSASKGTVGVVRDAKMPTAAEKNLLVEAQKKVLEEAAFASLSIKDKAVLEKKDRKGTQLHGSSTNQPELRDGDLHTLESEVSTMNGHERNVLRQATCNKDVKKWMLKSNLESLREAEKQLDSVQHNTGEGIDVSMKPQDRSLKKLLLNEVLSNLVVRKTILAQSSETGKSRGIE